MTVAIRGASLVITFVSSSLLLAGCAVIKQKEIAEFPRGAHNAELDKLLPDMLHAFPAKEGKARQMALVHPRAETYVEGHETHRRIYAWVGVERPGLGGKAYCFVEMHDFDQTKTAAGWSPPTWFGRSTRDQEKDRDGTIDCAKLARGD